MTSPRSMLLTAHTERERDLVTRQTNGMNALRNGVQKFKGLKHRSRKPLRTIKAHVRVFPIRISDLLFHRKDVEDGCS